MELLKKFHLHTGYHALYFPFDAGLSFLVTGKRNLTLKSQLSLILFLQLYSFAILI